MIYLVTLNQTLFESENYKIIGIDESLSLLSKCNKVQYDSESTGLDCHIDKLLSIQFGNDTYDFQIVVDCTTIDILIYKDILEQKYLIGHNLKFDIQWLYNYGIIPRRVYDTMIVEQLLYLGYPNGIKSYSLKSVAYERLNIDIDKTVRGNIIWQGLNESTILYSATDVMHLEKIMYSQLEECREKDCLIGAKLECDFTPVIAYLEWCGIKLDIDKWKQKMKSDIENLASRKEELDKYITEKLPKYSVIDRQGNLFTGFDLTPKCTINWDSSKQVIQVCKDLGFNTAIQDKKTGEDKDSVLEKTLKTQKDIDDKFLNLYFDYKESSKVCSTYGQGHLNAVNPITGRIHTVFRALGASSGRMSSGSTTSNTSLAKLNKVPAKECTYPNLQQLPADHQTRSCFVAEEGNCFCSADFSAMEGRLAADIYEDKTMIDDFLYGTKDSHSLFAWLVFRKECEQCGCTSVFDVKSKAPQWRKAVKAVEFAYLFGAAAPTISQSANCTVEKAQEYINSLNEGFKGLNRFVIEGSKFVRKNGYVLMNKHTGHKMYWWDHNKWLERQSSFTQDFWEDYRQNHKGTGDEIALIVREHFQAASKWDRMARNGPTQGTGACITKLACINFFNWLVDNGYFHIIKLVCIVHDEVCIEYPKHMKDVANILEKFMEEAASKYCKSLPIPAEASVGEYWIH